MLDKKEFGNSQGRADWIVPELVSLGIEKTLGGSYSSFTECDYAYGPTFGTGKDDPVALGSGSCPSS